MSHVPIRLSYFAFGLNHRTAPVAVRERFELGPEEIRALYAERTLPGDAEWIVLSTCNRTEVYLYGSEENALRAREALARRCGSWPDEHAFVFDGEEAIRHVLEVASGLRSQVLGDGQILNQIKDAYRLAAEGRAVGPRLHRLMHVAFATAKRVITSTALGSGGASIARTAVGTLRHTSVAGSKPPGELDILVLGCGGMGERIVKELQVNPPGILRVSNRTASRAERVAARYGATVVSWEDRHAAAARADVVFSAAGADGFVLRNEELNGLIPDKPTLFVDIAVPRSIDPALADRPLFSVVNIDELSLNGDGPGVVSRNVARAERICDEAVRDAAGWEVQTRVVEPAVRTLHETFESIRRREVERNRHRFNAADQENVDRLTRSIMQKLIAIPIVRLKAMAADDDDLADRIELLSTLFDKGDCEE